MSSLKKKVVKFSSAFHLKLGISYHILAQMDWRKAIRISYLVKYFQFDSEVRKRQGEVELQHACLTTDHETERNGAESTCVAFISEKMPPGKVGRGLASNSGFAGWSHGVPLILNLMPPVATPFPNSYKSSVQAEALRLLWIRLVWRIQDYSMDLKAKNPARLIGDIIIAQHSNWLLITQRLQESPNNNRLPSLMCNHSPRIWQSTSSS